MYLGRVVGAGHLPGYKDFLAYAVSGRSESSRERKARITEGPSVMKVNIGPLDPGNLTEEQKEQSRWIFYNGIIASNEGFYALASNGEQTDAMNMLITEESLRNEEAMRCAMKVLGAERDFYNTPRIAAGFFGDPGKNYISIITEDGYYGRWLKLHSNPERMHYVSTYEGKSCSNDVVVPKGVVEIPMGIIAMHGNRAQDIADNLYDWMNPELVVCTAAALYDVDSRRFELAVRNLHE